MRVTTNYTTTKLMRILLFSMLAVIWTAYPSVAMDDVYQMSRSTGSAYDMSGSTTLFSRTSSYYGYTNLLSIGFTFNFDGTNYTTFSVNASGHLTLGKTAYYYGYYSYAWPEYTNELHPSICAYWGRYFRPYYYSDAKVHYKLVGSAPNRVLVVEWYGMYGLSSIFRGLRYQARLYEGSNKIEFWYSGMYSSSTSTTYSGAIGIASSTSRYLSAYGDNFPNDVYKNGNGPSSTYYRLYYEPIPDNSIWTFNPCDRKITVTGDLDEGGTEEMENLDVLLQGKETMRGSSESFYPFSLSNPDNGCDPVSYSATFSGPAAGDYAVVPGTVNLGERVSPEVVFTPQAIGERNATMQLKLSNGTTLTYGVSATGLTRMDWIANISEGGAPGMNNGAKLMENIDVNRNESGDFTPFTIENFNTDPSSKPAVIEYILEDPLDEYSISLGGVTGTEKGNSTAANMSLTDFVDGGSSSTPIVTFSPHNGGTYYGTGTQEATLTVIADGEERVYTLSGFSVAPAVEFNLEDESVILSDRRYFRNVVSCVGEQATTLRLDIENVNKVDVTINNFDAYEVDSRVQQGGPKYPLLENEWGNLVRSGDYILAEGSGIAPTTANTLAKFPMTLKPGERRTYYLTFVAQRPGKRYSRLFMQTTGVNFFSPSMENFMEGSETNSETEGLMVMEFYGRGVGSNLAKNLEGDLSGLALTFDPVKVGESVIGEATIYNTGDCDMRINQGNLILATGDTKEFELIEVMNGITLDNGDYVIPPGGSGTVKARFTPNRSGSRRASVMLQTNDSTVIIDGITERGIYYLNLYGVGKADLRAQDARLGPAVIDGPGSSGSIHVVNTSTEVIEITGLSLVGPNVGEIAEDPANPWPALPIRLDPEEMVDLAVVLNPAAGSQSGPRVATMEITYNGGDMITAQIVGTAGTRLLTVGPATLFDGVNVPVGTIARRTAIISNTGTFPVELTDVRIEGTSAADYTMAPLDRRTIAPGGFEFVEIVYAPSATGGSDAKLVISSNATNGDQIVTLNGMATSTQFVDPSNGSSITQNGGTINAGRAIAAGAIALGQSVPNPAREAFEIAFNLPAEGKVEINLYNTNGLLVRTLLSEERTAGTHSLSIDTEGLQSGAYIYTLRQNGEVLTRSMTIVK
ncbi:MAG: choice-of-anchor D domain-containing protein [Candidatus Kapaibacterium sp.]